MRRRPGQVTGEQKDIMEEVKAFEPPERCPILSEALPYILEERGEGGGR